MSSIVWTSGELSEYYGDDRDEIVEEMRYERECADSEPLRCEADIAGNRVCLTPIRNTDQPYCPNGEAHI